MGRLRKAATFTFPSVLHPDVHATVGRRVTSGHKRVSATLQAFFHTIDKRRGWEAAKFPSTERVGVRRVAHDCRQLGCRHWGWNPEPVVWESNNRASRPAPPQSRPLLTPSLCPTSPPPESKQRLEGRGSVVALARVSPSQKKVPGSIPKARSLGSRPPLSKTYVPPPHLLLKSCI